MTRPVSRQGANVLEKRRHEANACVVCKRPIGEIRACCTWVSCNRGVADETANANYSARRQHVHNIFEHVVYNIT